MTAIRRVIYPTSRRERGLRSWLVVTFAALVAFAFAVSARSTPARSPYLTHPMLAPGATCPVTGPNHRRPPSAAHAWLDGGERALYGHWPLWVVIPTEPVGLRLPSGEVYAKIPWFVEAPGKLRIVGRRIDRKGGRLGADVPDGYGGGVPTHYVQPSSITVSGPGCWDVAGILGRNVVEWIYDAKVARRP